MNTCIPRLAAALLLVFGTAMAQDAPPPKVSVAAATSRQVTERSVFIGKGEAIDRIDIVARVTGFLEETAVANGAEVEEGDLLFKIESEAYVARLTQAEADLARAEANLALAQIELDRKRQLVERAAISQSELDIALADEQVAQAEVKSAQAAIRQAELDLEYTEIRAPFDGRIGRIQRSVGDLVSPDSGPLVTLVREAPIFVSFSLTERQLIDILEQISETPDGSASDPSSLEVFVELPNGRMLDETGRIAFGENRVDPTTGSISVRAEFANAARLILDGAFLNVSVEEDMPVERLTVPQAAVQRDQRGPFVLVVNDQQMVEQRYIETGAQIETDIIVLDGLREGEAVIQEGLQRVRPGAPVDAVLAGTTE